MQGTLNIFEIESIDGRVDRGAIAGSEKTAAFLYEIGPGQASCPYHYEYVALRAPAVSVYPDSNKIGVWPGGGENDLLFVRDTAVPWSYGEDGWDRA